METAKLKFPLCAISCWPTWRTSMERRELLPRICLFLWSLMSPATWNHMLSQWESFKSVTDKKVRELEEELRNAMTSIGMPVVGKMWMDSTCIYSKVFVFFSLLSYIRSYIVLCLCGLYNMLTNVLHVKKADNIYCIFMGQFKQSNICIVFPSGFSLQHFFFLLLDSNH